MDVREATASDSSTVQNVATRSMYASYSLSPSTIDSAVEEWYGDGAFEDLVEADERVVLLAEQDDDAVGFADAEYLPSTEQGDLLWLHVHPDYRGEGVARRLLDEARAAMESKGASYLRGLVLADNSEGNAFYEYHEFEQVGERDIDIDGDRFVENIYQERTPAEPDPVTTEDDETVYVDRTEATSGSIAPFHPVFSDADRESLWGYFCTNCDSTATAMDSMERIECSDCGNTRKPKRWDAAYL